MTNLETSGKTWRFFRAGGFDQVKLETGEDLLALDQLDLKLWVALACPTSGLEFDKATLDLIDTDKDGRVRAPELIAAVKWAGSLLRNPDDLLLGSATLRVGAIDQATPEGQLLATFARQVLGKAESDTISIDDAAVASKALAAKPFNGDGIVPADSAAEESTKAVINDILACLGADTDASGKPGIGQAKADRFFTDATAYSEWWKQAEGNAVILPLGSATAEAAAAVKAVKAKVNDYFARGQLAAFDSRAMAALNREEKEFLLLAAKDLTVDSAEIAGLPLARVGSNSPLPLAEGINPAWASRMAALQAQAVKPLLGTRTTLTEADWAALVAKLAPYEAWSSAKAGESVERLGLKRVREILAGKAKATLTALIAQDKAEDSKIQAAADLSRLVRYHRDLIQLCRNFVSFQDFYGRKQKAIFQAGTLYLDQRSCDLCLTVEEPPKHAALAGLAGSYLAYCDCVRKGTGEKKQIVAVFTGGDSDNLMVGRNGIFFDTKGRDWDATVSKIVDNPISIRQAFWAPYKKLVRMIEEQIAKRATTAEADTHSRLQTAAQQVATVDKAKPAEPPKKIDTGTLAAIGLVLTSLLGVFATIFTRLAGMSLWQIPLVIAGLILAISCPSMIIAWLKLGKRNLGPILDANGWAVNAKAKINVPFGGSLTQVAALPRGAQRDLVDPFAEKRRPWGWYFALLLILLLALLWYLGKVDSALPNPARSTNVLGSFSPGYVPPAGTNHSQ